MLNRIILAVPHSETTVMVVSIVCNPLQIQTQFGKVGTSVASGFTGLFLQQRKAVDSPCCSFHSLFSINQQHTNEKLCAHTLKMFGLSTIEPALTLSKMTKALGIFAYPKFSIPTAEGHIYLYLQYLRKQGFLTYDRRGGYRKLIPYGPRYQKAVRLLKNNR